MAFDLTPKHREFIIIALLVVAILLLAYIIYETHRASESFAYDCSDCAERLVKLNDCNMFLGMAGKDCTVENLEPILVSDPYYINFCGQHTQLRACSEVSDAKPVEQDQA